MDKRNLSILNAKLAMMIDKENEYRQEYKKIALDVLVNYLGGNFTFASDDDIKSGNFENCPSIVSCTFDEDVTDAYITKISIDRDNNVRINLWSNVYYNDQVGVHVEDEPNIDWEQIASTLTNNAIENIAEEEERKKNENVTIFPAQSETIEVYLDEYQHPVAWREAVLNLTNNGMDITAAENIIRKAPITLELAYSKEQGLFAIESDAVASLRNDIVDPYTGKHVEVLGCN